MVDRIVRRLLTAALSYSLQKGRQIPDKIARESDFRVDEILLVTLNPDHDVIEVKMSTGQKYLITIQEKKEDPK